MNSSGITVDEACASRVIGTEEDFERLCNEDGTVKNQPKTTTLTLKNDNSKSITVNNTYLQIAIACLLIALLITVVLVFRKLNKKSQKVASRKL